jgi:hypothetical protein
LVVCAAALASLLASGSALAQDAHDPVRAAQDITQPCPGQPIDDGDANAGPDQVMTGTPR